MPSDELPPRLLILNLAIAPSMTMAHIVVMYSNLIEVIWECFLQVINIKVIKNEPIRTISSSLGAKNNHKYMSFLYQCNIE